MRKLPLIASVGLALAVVSPTIAAEPYQAEGFEGQPVLITGETVDGGAVVYPEAGKPEIAGVLLTIQPGGRSDLHHHPVAAFVYVLEGEFELRQGEVVRRFKVGEALIEPIGSPVQAFNPGSVPTKVLVVHIGSTEVESIVRDQ
jgi:quercetin dioxygenase-like cupin family protein